VFVYEIYDMFRQYVDEADETFLTPAQCSLMLQNAYNDMQNIALQVDPTVYQNSVILSVANAADYDLSTGVTRIMGATANFPPLRRLLDIYSIDVTTQAFGQQWTSYRSQAEMRDASGGVGNRSLPLNGPSYCLIGQVLFFPAAVTDDIIVFYAPYPSKPRNTAGIDWSKVTLALGSEFVDDFDDHHELIALFAAKRYAVRDNASNPELNELLAKKTDEFKQFLYSGRDGLAAPTISLIW
jgi:hypothetical protein